MDDILKLAVDRQWEKVEEAWLTAAENPPADVGALLRAADLLVADGEAGRATPLLELLYGVLRDRSRWAEVLEVLRRLAALKKGVTEEWRETCAKAVQGANPGRPGIEVYLREAGIAGGREFVQAVARLDRFLLYGKGQCVFHAAGWGIGQVTDVDPATGDLVVDLEKKKGHRIPIVSAAETLDPLPPEHLQALAAFNVPAIRKMMEEDPVAVLRTAVRSLGNEIPVSRLKGILAGPVIPEDAWGRWWGQARRKAAAEGCWRIGDGVHGKIEMLDAPVAVPEDPTAELRRQPTLLKMISVAKKAVRKNQSAAPAIREFLFREIDEGIRRGASPGNLAQGLLFLENEAGGGAEVEPFWRALLTEGEGFSVVKALPVVESLPGAHARKFLDRVHAMWPDGYLALCEEGFSRGGGGPRGLFGEALRQAGRLETVTTRIIENYERHPAAFMHMADDVLSGRCPGDVDRMVACLAALGEEIAFRGKGKREMALLQGIRDILARGDFSALKAFCEKGGREDVLDVFGRLESVSKLVPGPRAAAARVVARRFPDALGGAETAAPAGFWVSDVTYTTRAGYERRSREFRDIMDNQIPANSRAIGEAAKMGDLSENAEYKAALEEQFRLTGRAEGIRVELEKIRFIEEESGVEGSQVTPGTRVVLENLGTGLRETYVILGPWDANPERGVISYRAATAQGILGKKPGEEAVVTLPDRTVRYRVIDIVRNVSGKENG